MDVLEMSLLVFIVALMWLWTRFHLVRCADAVTHVLTLN